MASSFPKPTPFMIGEAVTRGLAIPAIEIDPRFNFVRGAYIFASDIQMLDLKLRTFKEPLEIALTQVVIPSIRENFAAQGRPAWKPLKQKTIYGRLLKGYPRGPILDASGRLKRAATKKNIWEITSAIGRDGADMLKMRTVYFDQLVPYGQFHQLGANIPRERTTYHLKGFITGGRGLTGSGGLNIPGAANFSGFRQRSRTEIFPTTGGTLPARPFIQLQLQDEVDIYEIFTAFLVKKVNQYWGTKGDAGL